jgi:hypothetical protein
MVFAPVAFFISLLGIVGLFAIKHFEAKRQTVIYPELRKKVDNQALRLKSFILMKRVEASQFPSAFLHFMHRAVHAGALGAARFARFVETQSHRLADFVSHKHHFKKRETRSEFLKKVREHTRNNGNSSGAGSGDNGSERL